MIFDPLSREGAAMAAGQQRRLFRRKEVGENQVGLLPTPGWRKRNLQFLGEVLIPALLSPRRRARAFEAVPQAQADEVGVTWLGHAGFFLQVGAVNVVVDPNWALWHGPVKRVRQPGLWPHDLTPVDLVLVTHAHFDHLHLPSLRKLADGQPIVVPKGVGVLVKRCGFGQIVELDTWQMARFKDLHITMTPARHWGARMIHDTHRQFGGYLITGPERTVFHCGDSAMFDGFSEIGKRAKVDVALMPIGAYDAPSGRQVHMNPEEALEAFQILEGDALVPMHHDTFPLGGEPLHEPVQRLWTEADRLQVAHQVRVLDEGESVLFK
jgi:L-ascorbate metabolism protein UlaG (beta-lactamase superfamily)